MTKVPSRAAYLITGSNKRNTQSAEKLKGKSFGTMLGRADNETINMVIGDRALRGIPAHDERFAMGRDDPQISTKMKQCNNTQWKLENAVKEKTLSIVNSNYCNNSYKPGCEIRFSKSDVGCKYNLPKPH